MFCINQRINGEDEVCIDEITDPQKNDENPSLKLLIKFQRLLIAELYALGRLIYLLSWRGEQVTKLVSN